VKLGGLDENRAALSQVQHLIIAACGTSYHAALYGAALLRWLSALDTVQVFDAAELVRYAAVAERQRNTSQTVSVAFSMPVLFTKLTFLSPPSSPCSLPQPDGLLSEVFPRRHGGFACISQSGETRDVLRALELAQEMHVPCFSVVNVVGSQIARLTKCGVYLNAGREVP
jgi:glucosamine--fructose-6-phosphate aminotransferase (isomerizing)